MDTHTTVACFSWKSYKACHDRIQQSDKYGRKTFLSDFTNYLTDWLQKNTENKCRLVSEWNYIKKNENSKPYWSGYYICYKNYKSNGKECPITYDCIIETKPIAEHPVEVFIIYTGLSEHELLANKNFLRKEQRIAMATKILTKGLTNVYNQMIIENIESPELNCNLSFFLFSLFFNF
jgi:hypothetical protein